MFRCITGKTRAIRACPTLVKTFITLFALATSALADECKNTTSHVLPKKIQAEQFCASHGIRGIEVLDALNVTYVDALRKGDWVEFNVTIEESAKYDLSLAYASRKGGQVQITASTGMEVRLSLPKTDTDKHFAITTIEQSLSKGQYRLRIEGLAGSVNVDWLSVIQNLTQERSPLESGTYSFISEHSRRSLDVQDRSTSSGANIQQWEYVASDNQQWQLIDHGGNSYEVRSVFSGHCLAIDMVMNNVIQQDCSNDISQRWSFDLIAANFFVIKSRAVSGVMSVLEEGTYNGANVVVSPFAQQKSQLWRVGLIR